MNRDLHPYQTRAISLLRQSLAGGHRRPLLQLPTGAGKTVIAAAIVESALAKRKRVLMTVPLLSLVDQTVERFAEEGIHAVGVMQGMHPATDCTQPVQVASVQTLARRMIPEADLVIVDEAHKQFKFTTGWLASSAMANVPVIGLSATPRARGLGKTYDDLVVGAGIRELIDAEFLSDYRIYAPSHPDLTGIRTVAGDYHEGELSEAMQRPALVADVVSTWRKLGENRTTLVFAVDRAHARRLQNEFEEAGVSVAYIDAFTESRDRQAIFRQFHDGAARIIVSVATLTTGIDLDVRCIVLARPTKSEMLYVQIAGRGLRVAEAKDYCLLLDHSDTTLRLGFPDSIHHDKLDDGSPRSSSTTSKEHEEPLPKECSACHFLKPARVHKCPSCGFAPERQSNVQTIDGDLSELDAAQAKKIKKSDRHTKQKWFSQLHWIASQRGYKDGWVANQYKAKFGVWPQGLILCDVPADAEVAGWVRHRMIRYAKSRQAAA
jgi:DNA repair protein RadD